MIGGMTSTMTKTSVTIARADLEMASRLGINVSEVARTALRQRLREQLLEQEVDAYTQAFAEWDEGPWDHLAGDDVDIPEGQ
jgi:post-segregation antitoxin (ccd killing protein)